MDGEPYRWLLRLRPLDAVAFSCGDEDVIARPQRARGRLVFELQGGATLEYDHPLVPRLIVPELFVYVRRNRRGGDFKPLIAGTNKR